MRNDSSWHRYWRYLSARFRPEIAEELGLHIELRARELEKGGLTPEQALTEARRRFGDAGRVRQQLERIETKRGRRATFALWANECAQDIRYGARTLLRRPGFTLMTAASLAIGITAAAVVLSVVDSWLLRPLPVRDPGSLIVIGASTRATGGLTAKIVSVPTVRDLQARRDLFDDAAAVQLSFLAVRATASDIGERRLYLATTGNYFSLLGVPASIGRVFSVDDERQRARVIVLTNQAWLARFGGDPTLSGGQSTSMPSP